MGIFIGSVSTGFDISKGDATPEKTMLNYVLGGALAGRQISQQLSINAIYKGVEASAEKKSNDEIIAGQASSAIGTLSGTMAEIALDSLKVKGIKKQAISNVFSNYFENNTENILSDDENKAKEGKK